MKKLTLLVAVLAATVVGLIGAPRTAGGKSDASSNDLRDTGYDGSHCAEGTASGDGQLLSSAKEAAYLTGHTLPDTDAIVSLAGKITDEGGAAVQYANVALLSAADSVQVTGAMSDAEGRFRISAPCGDYFVKVYCIGYLDHMAHTPLSENTALPDIVLTVSATEMEAVTVKAHTIVREADRFVVNIANNPVAIGKDAFEMLKASPGVWISKDQGITVNGRPGTRIMVNDRLLRMDGDQLEAYLRSIDAEDIIKIEIIPATGAEHDADSSGGIIKITLNKHRNDGLQGSVGISGEYGYYGNWNVRPSVNINYQTGKWNLYGNGSFSSGNHYLRAQEETEYRGDSPIAGSRATSDAEMLSRSRNYNVKVGGVYDIDKSQSVGAELGYHRYGSEDITNGVSSFVYAPGLVLPVDSITSVNSYDSRNATAFLSTAFNYVLKLDEKGSTFKLIGDYNQSVATNPNTYNDIEANYLSGVQVGERRDSLYRSHSDTDYKIASLNANFDYVFSPTTVIKFGGKYTYNNLYSKMLYDIFDHGSGEWENQQERTTGADYVEHIGALYAAGNARFGRLGLSLGLRGEFTAIRPDFTGVNEGTGEEEESGRNKNYFDVFPSVNMSYSLNEAQSNSLILSYSRKISRPGFWALTPYRTMLSQYSSIVGNPNLRPSYVDDISLTGVLKYRYSLTVGVQIMTDRIMQRVVPADGEDDRFLSYKFVNLSGTRQYYAALNAPVNITRWWTLNANLVGGYLQQRLDEGDELTGSMFAFAHLSTIFSLPKNFDIELTYWRQSRMQMANLIGLPVHNLGAAVKKRFADNKFTASLEVDNMLQGSHRVNSYGPEFYKKAVITNNNGQYMTVSISLRYNFRSGVSFKAKQVEKDSADDAKRIGSQ